MYKPFVLSKQEVEDTAQAIRRSLYAQSDCFKTYATSIVVSGTRKMEIVDDCCACHLHQVFCHVQYIGSRFRSLLHSRHVLCLKAMHCSFGDASAYGSCRRLFLLTGLFVGCSIEGYEEDKVRA